MAKRTRQFYINTARQYAMAQKIDPRVFLAMLNQEAHFDPTAVSYAGARGIGQIMPFHDVDPRRPGHQVAGKDPLVDLRWSAAHLAQMFRKYGSYEKALSVYNSGQPDKYLDPNFAKGQTYNYVKKIMGSLGDWRGGGQVVAPQAPRSGSSAVLPSAVPLPPRRDDSAIRRQALLGSLVDRQNAYLAGDEYDGPSARERYSSLLSLLPAPVATQSESAAPGPIVAGAARPVGGDGKPLKGAALMATLIAEARRRGLRVSENAAVDHVDPVHTKGSDHYRRLGKTKYSAGLDVGGNPDDLRDYFLWASRYSGGKGLKDLFFDPMRYSYDEGRRWNRTIGGHGTHVHASVF